MSFQLDINGRVYVVEDISVATSLLTVLRDHLSLYGSKNACEQGECGSCSVLMDGDVVCACLVLADQAAGRAVQTIEGMFNDPVSKCVQSEMVKCGGVQCGFCTPGFVVTATAILNDDLHQDENLVREKLAGNLCRCTGYSKIIEAVLSARSKLVTGEHE